MHNHEGISTDQPAHEVPRMHAAWKGAAIMLVAIVGFYVLREHWGHALGVAPYLLLLALLRPSLSKVQRLLTSRFSPGHFEERSRSYRETSRT